MAAHWHPTPLPTLPAVLTSDGHTAWAALSDGSLFASPTSGRTWQQAPHGSLPAEPLALLAGEEGLLAATEGGVYHWQDGRGWVDASDGLPPGELVTVLAAVSSGVVAGTFASGLYHTPRPFDVWRPAHLDGAFQRHAIFALASGVQGLYAAHPLGLSRSPDGGATWESASFGLPPSVVLNAVFAGNTLWASGNGAVFRSDDWLSWQSVYARGHMPPLVLVACTDEVLVARETDSTRLHRSHDGGVTWHAFASHVPEGFFATHGIHVRDALLISTLPGGVWRCDVSGLRKALPPLELLTQALDARGHVAFSVRTRAHVVLSVHDVQGDEVARLVDGTPTQGYHQHRLDDRLPAGLYEWRLTGGGTSQARSFLYLP